MTVTERLAEMGVTLPKPPAPIASYVGAVRSGGQVIVSGQLSLGPDGKLPPGHVGKVGGAVSVETAGEAARACAINVLAQVAAVLAPSGGTLDDLRCLRLGGFINGADGFTGLASVMNGASDLMVAALGDRGRHARSTVGVAELPLGACVEVEAVFAVDGAPSR